MRRCAHKGDHESEIGVKYLTPDAFEAAQEEQSLISTATAPE